MISHCFLSSGNNLSIIINCSCKFNANGQPLQPVLSKLKGGLITFEQALEDLGIMTDFDTIIERRKIEEEKIKKAGLKFETLFAPDGGGSNDDDTEIDKKEITRRK